MNVGIILIFSLFLFLFHPCEHVPHKVKKKKNTAMLNEVGIPEGNSMIRYFKKIELKFHIQLSSENGIYNQRGINILIFYIPCNFQ